MQVMEEKNLSFLTSLSKNQPDIEAMSWFKAASMLSRDLQIADSEQLMELPFKSSAEVMARFAALRGITLNTARRQLAVTDFLQRVVSADQFSAALEDAPPPFNTLETLKKIHDLDPERSSELLPAVLGRRITFVEISKQYESLLEKDPQNPKRLAIRREAAQDFEKQVLEALSFSHLPLYPEKAKVKIGPLQRSIKNFAFSLPDGIAIRKIYEQTFTDAIEIRMPTAGARHQIWQILERIQLVSTFFTHTWLILPKPMTKEQEGFIAGLVSAKETLGLPSVGIALASLNEPVEFEVMARPTGLSEIDRRHLFPRL